MKAKRYALDPAFGMLVDCPNMCGEPERLELVERGGGGRWDSDTFRCTGCGAEKQMHTWAPFLSLEFSID